VVAEHRLGSAALPYIPTRVYGYPWRAACEAAVAEVLAWQAANEWPRQVTFCCFGAAEFRVYQSRVGTGG
jgi:O-acetyl-ADP-ribose deacetylase (regulator of RNase III)